MADFYAIMIVRGYRTYEDTPALIKDDVKQALIELGVWDKVDPEQQTEEPTV